MYDDAQVDEKVAVGCIWGGITIMVVAICATILIAIKILAPSETSLSVNCIAEYADASVQRRLCLEEEGVVLYTQGRGADAPIRQVLNAPSVQ